MTIKYDLTNNYLKYYNEANGVYLKRKKLLKKNIKILNYSTYNLIYFISSLILNITFLIIYTLYSLNIFYYLAWLFSFTATIFLICILNLFIMARLKFNSKKGTIILDSNGILDKSFDDKTIIFPWNKLNLVAITKNTITFIFDSPIILILKNENKEKIIKEIKKYTKASIIISD